MLTHYVSHSRQYRLRENNTLITSYFLRLFLFPEEIMGSGLSLPH